MSKKPAVTLTLEIVERGAKCPRRGIPLVDVYLMGSANSGSGQGCWMQALDMSQPMAEVVAAWFAERGVEVQREALEPAGSGLFAVKPGGGD